MHYAFVIHVLFPYNMIEGWPKYAKFMRSVGVEGWHCSRNFEVLSSIIRCDIKQTDVTDAASVHITIANTERKENLSMIILFFAQRTQIMVKLITIYIFFLARLEVCCIQSKSIRFMRRHGKLANDQRDAAPQFLVWPEGWPGGWRETTGRVT